MPRDLDQDEIDQLNKLISICGLDSVLMALSELCGTKGVHLASTNASKAKQWFTMEGAIGTLSTQARELS